MPVQFHFFLSDHTHRIHILASLEVDLDILIYEEKNELNTASYRIINL